ncbi:MAG: flagellar type III secretion system pore protein FliP [Anaerolineae bacterium]|nr:flagellar type III secretion system pore protein FliP [Anaerolineae bacterium]
MKQKRLLLKILLVLLPLLLLTACSGTPQLTAPGVTLTVGEANQPENVNTGVQLLVLLTVLSLAPSIIIMATSFTRIVIVLSLLRNAIGTPTVPPTQVLVGLALILTFFVMAPTYSKIDEQAIQPYLNGQINQETAITRGLEPVRDFMFRQTREKDLELFVSLNNQERPQTRDDISMVVLMPAFIISELRTAFTMGFVLFVPFLVMDIVISSVLLSMGMMMLPPSLISLPFKLLLFVMVDGWYLVTQSLVMSFK